MEKKLKRIFGIDLGTTYSCIAHIDEYEKLEIIPDADYNRPTVPSVVYFEEEGNVVVGESAKESSVFHPLRVVSEVKRHMGDPSWRFDLDGDPSKHEYRPEEISSLILRKLCRDAEQRLGYPVRDVVITCPAYFGIAEREATKQAGELAGLTVHSIINEPTAAALAYGMENEENQTILVFDLGGGTFDVTLLDIKNPLFTVICTGGDHQLGGRDWDKAVIAYLADEFTKQTNSSDDPLDDPETLAELFIKVEAAKKTLSTKQKAHVRFSYQGESISLELTRDIFDQKTNDLLERTIMLTDEMLKQAALKNYTRFDQILLVGGSTKMPQVTARLKQRFPDLPIQSFYPDEAVARGAALYGWKLGIDKAIQIAIKEKTGQPLGDYQLGSQPDFVLKAALREVAEANALRLDTVSKLGVASITNVASKSFGIVAFNRENQEVVCNLAKINDSLPISVTEMFGTRFDFQEQLSIKVMENKFPTDEVGDLGECKLIKDGYMELPPGLPANSPIEVKFTLNAEGILELVATELSTRREVNIRAETAAVMSLKEFKESAKHLGGLVVL